MTTQRAIVTALLRAAADEQPVVLATVVRVTGSSYGGVGARMVVRVDGTTVGVVSGGCLETDLADQARIAHQTGKPALVTYDTRADDDAAWGLGLGCNGMIEVLLEPLSPVEAAAVGRLLEQALAAQSACILATVINAEPLSPAMSSHVVFDGETITTTGDWGDRNLLKVLGAKVSEALAEGRRGLVREFGGVQVAFETVLPAVRLVICGSGPDVIPLVKLGSELGWYLTVVDHRPVEHAQAERFPDAIVVECRDASNLHETIRLTPRTGAVVMSHHFERDLEYVHSLLQSSVGYIGVLGPRARTERMIAELASRSGDPLHGGERLFGPVGLDIGGDGPEAIALSIISEVSAVTSGRRGGHLRDRRSPLHTDAGVVTRATNA
ncbi:MAG TPA: XdhC family protein [Gemmatimonadaceae bacterium]|nr:XdhC family protein [Gemmatimonadaceae bacterium]